MSQLRRRSFLVGAAALGLCPAVRAAGLELVVLSSGGFTPAFRALAPEFAEKTGDTTRLVLGASMGETETAIPKAACPR